MWSLVIGIVAVAARVCVADSNSMYFCSDMNPQPHVDIEQLMGMWYGIELISHAVDAKHEVIYEDGCPILYFLEDRTPTTTEYPNYPNRNYNYQQNYGGSYGRGYQQYETTTDRDENPRTSYEGLLGQHSEFYNRRTQYGVSEYFRRNDRDLKKLRLMWDEKGVNTEYTMRYNTSMAGFWISSGPQNGSALDAKFNDFAGVVQVLKAVGNHMVLLFCHQLPDQRLYSVLLSRVRKLNRHEINGVHSLLNRRGLSTTSIKKVCTHGGSGRIESLAIAILFLNLVTMRLL